ncbi:MAG: glutathione S-transferase family protein [Alphaproteobacteria bacterium]|nr:glutathione S-transferase family protein [Alphaproteobacteria bacterium]
MITIHHLGMSQSDRIVWLMEELGLPYELKWYDRGEDRLLPDDYLALHPAAMAPVIQDGDTVLTESGAIVEYISHRYANGKLTVGPDQPNYAEYLYWMHFNNNVLGIFLANGALPENRDAPEVTTLAGLINRRQEQYFTYLDQRLGASPYLAGPEFTCADVMVNFSVTALPLFGGRGIDDLPNVQAYVARIGERPAYQKAMAIAGPAATRPSA